MASAHASRFRVTGHAFAEPSYRRILGVSTVDDGIWAAAKLELERSVNDGLPQWWRRDPFRGALFGVALDRRDLAYVVNPELCEGLDPAMRPLGPSCSPFVYQPVT